MLEVVYWSVSHLQFRSAAARRSRAFELGGNDRQRRDLALIIAICSMDPFSITASVVGIVGPALHLVRLILDDLQRIIDGPEAVVSLREELLSLLQALAAVEAIAEPQWKSLGEAVAV